jgi:ketosteroid isomerase-like protein
MDAREIAAEVYRLWATQDVESTFAYVAEDVVYALHFDEDLAPFAGVSHGREAMMGAFYKMIEEFDYLKYEPTIVGVEGDVVRVQVQFRFHHRRTGADLEGSMRSVMTLTDGQIVRCEEYLDRGLVEAFMRLTRHREATNQVVKPPEIPGRRPLPDSGASAGAHMSEEEPPVKEELVPASSPNEEC